MKIIVISNTSDVESEHLILHRLFEEGLEYFHVRKPKYSTRKLKDYLEKIDKKYRNRVVIHTHHELCIPYKLKGFHLTNRHRNRRFLQTWFMMRYIKFMRPDIQVTTSFHVINSLKRYNPEYAYVFLSPIFDSISKIGYKNTFSEATLKEGLSQTQFQVIAMGGVMYDVLDKVKDYGFHGFALLGGLWNSPDPVEEFKKIVEKCKQLESTSLV
jgi:thiamine-phosphate pyrophosphorylase